MYQGELTETIEQVHGKIWFCQRGVYGRSSVLAGQDFRQLVRPYDTVEEALADHPTAQVELDWDGPINFVPQLPPPDFDPLDAGEVWSEEDY